MAYANLIAVSCTNPKESFKRLRDFLCKRNGSYDYSTTGIGWTLHDAVYAVDQDTISINDYFVVYSSGEDTYRRMYYKIVYISGYFNVYGYLYWNNSTHAGVQQFGASSSWTNTLDTNNILWVYGDLDRFVGITKYSTSYYGCSFGWMPDSSISQAVTAAPNSITAGSSVTVTFSSTPPAEWVAGVKLFIEDTANIERATISSVSGNNVTFTTIANSYAAGALFTREKTQYVTTSNMSTLYYMLIDHSNTKNGTATPEHTQCAYPSSGDGLTGLYSYKKIFLGSSTMVVGPLKDFYITTTNFTSESTHTIGTTNYRMFNLSSSFYCLIKEV